MNYYSLEKIAKQRVKEFRQEADLHRLANRAGMHQRKYLINRFFSWWFRKSGDQQHTGQRWAKGLPRTSAE
jgi:hypothetical protein